MESHANWISDGPDTLELEAVLASGLHDGIHEDQLEDMSLKEDGLKQVAVGGGPRLAQVRKNINIPPLQRVERASAPRKHDTTTEDWFQQNYPKLKPADLADYYREKYLKVHVPVRTGTHDGFKQLRNLLAQHVHNSNALDDRIVEPEPQVTHLPAHIRQLDHEAMLPPRLDLAALPLGQVRPSLPVNASSLPRTSSVVLMTLGALVVGALIGLGLANPSLLGSLLNADVASASVQTWIPVSLWK